MDKIYNISGISFEDEYMIVEVNGSELKVKMGEASQILANASEQERNDYKISPSGYGIHWKQLDEDLSINGLVKLAIQKNVSLKNKRK